MDYKNQFVDENSYLVYGSEPDTAYDGSGGGGGGGVEPLICEYNGETLNKTLGEIYRAYTAGNPVIYYFVNEGETVDPRAGNYSSLAMIEFFGDDDNGYSSGLQFANAAFFTDTASTFDGALEQYPVMSD